MKATSIELKLAAVEAPKLVLNRSTGVIEWGKAHGFPARLLELVRNSPTQSSITKTRAALVSGEGFTQSRSATLNGFLDAKLFVKGRARKQQFLSALAQDYATFGGFAFQVIPARGGQIAQLYYQRFSTVASGEMDEDEVVRTYHLCGDWSKRGVKFPITTVPAFNPENIGSEPSLYVYFNASAEQDYYPQPSFFSALNYLETEAELAKYHVSNVSSRFSAGTILSVPAPLDFTGPDGQVVTAAAQQRTFTDGLKANLTGPDGDRVLVLFEENPELRAQVQAYTDGQPSDLFSTYAALCREQILAANRVPSPAIVGLSTGASLGGEANTLRAAFSLYYWSVCRPDQLDILSGLRDVLAYVAGVEQAALDELDITTTLPAEAQLISTPAGQAQLDALVASSITREAKLQRLTQMYGLSLAEAEKLIPAEAVAGQTEAQAALSGSVGGQSAIDAMLTALAQQLTTRESCVARLQLFYGLTPEQAELIVPTSQPALPLPAAA